MMPVTVMGALTAAFGAMAALGQNDLQKAIGYACLSQVGFMPRPRSGRSPRASVT